MSIFGMDLSMTATRVTTLEGEGKSVLVPNEYGQLETSSDLYFNEDGSVLVGMAAANAGAMNPPRHVRFEKRFVGTDEVLFVHPDTGKKHRAVDLQAIRIEAAKRDIERATGTVPTKVVITVPANYSDPQIESIRAACKKAGLELISTPKEPTAAGFGNRLHSRADGVSAVCDLGAATFDFSILEVSGNSVTTIITRGVNALGGKDFSDRLLEIVLSRFEAEYGFRPNPETHAIALFELDQRIETAKLDLSVRSTTQLVWTCDGHVLSTEVTRAAFEAAVSDLVDQALDCVDEALRAKDITPGSLNELLMVGGGAKVPLVAEQLKERFDLTPSSHVDPFYAVALGAVEIGRIEQEARGQPVTVGRKVLPRSRHTLSETTPYPFGVAVINESKELINSVILDEGVVIPSDHVETFTLEKPGQTAACIRILQGRNGAPASECVELGVIELDDLPAISDRPHSIEVRLTIDKLGMLRAEAVDPHCGKRGKMVISYDVAEEVA